MSIYRLPSELETEAMTDVSTWPAMPTRRYFGDSEVGECADALMIRLRDTAAVIERMAAIGHHDQCESLTTNFRTMKKRDCDCGVVEARAILARLKQEGLA